ncbi:MAG TPA: hypothetical protein VGJ05_06430 [Fimbriiglobus sp.]|jgi:multidrug resistance efflux pump
MSLPRRRNVIPLFVVLACVALTLVAANGLMHPDPTKQAGGNPPAVGRGLVVQGTVTSEPPLAYYGLPETMQAGKIRKIVDENSDVQAGTVLIEFDDTLAVLELGRAKNGVELAETKLLEAKLQETLYTFDVALQKIAVQAAKEDWASAVEMNKRAQDKFDRYLKGPNPQNGLPFTDEQKAQERKDNMDLFKLGTAVRKLATNYEVEGKKMEKLKAMKPSLLTSEAENGLAVQKAVLAKAKYAAEACVVKAAGPGVVGPVLEGKGAVIYPQSPAPVVVIPNGPRFVRAEVEPEFAYKLAGSEGKAVVVYDNNNFSLTYAGTVKRIGRAFMAKRNQGIEAFGVNGTKVLEVIIEITDSAPAGKPPLLVGQPVRVSFP